MREREAESSLPSGLVTFVFTDIEGSTPLHERLGEAYAQLAARHHALLGRIVAEHGGAVVNWLGDGMFAAFGDPAVAIRAVSAIRDAVSVEQWGVPLRVRIGLHTGPAQPRGRDYTALAVHVAARVCNAAHGGQVLASSDVPGTEGWLDQGQFNLPGLGAPVRLLALPGGPALSPRATRVVKHNVPAFRTSFVGRAAELAELTALVGSHRLVSVLGPGGTGKTRLTFEFVRQTSDSYADGAWVVLLADLTPGGDIAERVAATLGVRPAPGLSTRDALVDWCAAHEALVVLDNCEHVVPAAARLVDELLGDGSRARFVVTSREPLRLPGEVSWRLHPLDAPAEEPGDAVLLFLDRARLVRPDLERVGDVRQVAELCRQLDGLPLAIELAAARMRTMSLDGLLANVRDRVGLLRGRTHGVDERHQSLRALLDSSHDLLPEDERTALRRCAVFQSSFTAGAAAAVCDLRLPDAADLLERLADRSLLQVTADVEPRFRMLWTIRDYALDRLRDADDEADTAQRHAEWVTTALGPAARAAEAFEEEDPTPAHGLFAGLHDDAVAAMRHLADRGDARLAELANSMFWYWLATAAYATGTPWLALAGEQGDARALGRAGTFLGAYEPGSEAARDLLTRAVDLARSAGGERVLAECLVRLAAPVIRESEGKEGEDLCLEALRLNPVARDRGGAFMLLGIVASFRGDSDAAYARYEQAIRVDAGPSQVAICQGNIADILLDRGDIVGARERLLAALPVLEERQPSAAAWACRLLHRVALIEGDIDLAERWLDRGLRVSEAIGAAGSADTQSLGDLKAALPPRPPKPKRRLASER